MQRFLIIFGIIAVGYLAVTDTMERFRELDVMATNSTPAQEEMKSELMKSKGSGIENKFRNNLPDAQNYELPKNRSEKLKEEFQGESIKQPVVPKNLNTR